MWILGLKGLVQTPHQYVKFALSLGKEIPYIFSKFDLLNIDTLFIHALSMAPSVTGSDCAKKYDLEYLTSVLWSRIFACVEGLKLILQLCLGVLAYGRITTANRSMVNNLLSK